MIRYFAQHKTAANLLMAMVFLLGIMGTSAMLRETFPEFGKDKVVIQVVYKGATSQEVETAVCAIVEESVEGIEGVEEITSKASEGLATITVKMKEGYDLDILQRDIQNEVDQIDSLPEDAEDPLVFEQGQSMLPVDTVISLAISGDVDIRDLKKYAQLLKKEVLALDEISLVDLQGVSEVQIKIKILQQTLRSLGLSISQLQNIIFAQSKDLPMGSIESSDQEIIIRLIDQKYSPEEFADIIVISEEYGSQIKLGDIAQITWELEQEEQICYLNKKRAVVVGVSKASEEDALVIKDAVVRFVEEYKSKLPEGIYLSLLEDTATIVRDRLSLLLKNGIQGLILVFLTLCLFLDIRVAIWVTMGIPFSFLGALWIMELLGLTLNMITMVSLVLGIGLIVDDAIVIGENIFTHIQRGKKPLAACLDGTIEVAPGVLCSFLTTVAAFMPLIFMRGQMGNVLNVLPIGVILALGVSIVEAFIILPNHLNHSFEKRTQVGVGRWRAKIESSVDYFIQNIVAKAVRFCISNRYFSCCVVLMVFIISLGLLAGERLELVPFPELDGDVLVCYVLLPAGSPLEKTWAAVAKVEAGIDQTNRELTPAQPEQKQLVRNVKSQFGKNLDAGENGTHVATIGVELLTSEQRKHTCDEIIESWRKNVGKLEDVLSLKYSQLLPSPGGRAFEIRLAGDDLQVLSTASSKLQEKLISYEGVYNVGDNLKPGKWEILVTTLPLAKTLGFHSRDIFNQISAAFFGGKVQEFVLGQDSIEVRVQLADSDRQSLNNLEEFHLIDNQGQQIPLVSLAKLDIQRTYSNIYHVAGQRTVTITADIDTRKGNAAKILAEMQREFFPQFIRKYALAVNFEGQAKEMATTEASVYQGLIIGLALIYIILSFVFCSYMQPIVVMGTIPLGLAGAIFGHYFMGINMCMPSMVGVASLCGIVVNDSIVLVHFMNNHIRRGVAVVAAAQQASIDRFRAVTLTSITTIAGLLPLLLEKSVQAQILIPLAVSIAFGLLFATILVLVFIPCLMVIFHDLRILRFDLN